MRTKVFVRPYWTLPLQQQFLTHFSQLLESGYPTSAALDVLAVLFRASEVKKIKTACANGESFSTILKQLNFENRCCYMITCSEQVGALLPGIKKGSEFLKFNGQQRQELLKKVNYPLQLFLGVLVVIGALLIFFVPQIESFYASLNLNSDQSLLNIIIGVIATLLLFILTLSLLIYLTLHIKNKTFQQHIITVLFKFKLIQKVMSYYFSSQWYLFLSCGLSIKETLQMMNQFETIPLLKLILSTLQEKLEEGYPLDVLFQESPYFSPYFKLILSHALTCGTLESDLQQYQQFEFTYLTGRLNKAFKTIQFTLMLLIGILIILIYLSILQPVFDMLQLF
ncbi:MAG TPA: type II secretion protein F [Firmicutes bacterium]|nr:type II secretion protein F [Bacillota bacterium]